MHLELTWMHINPMYPSRADVINERINYFQCNYQEHTSWNEREGKIDYFVFTIVSITAVENICQKDLVNRKNIRKDYFCSLKIYAKRVQFSV